MNFMKNQQKDQSKILILLDNVSSHRAKYVRDFAESWGANIAISSTVLSRDGSGWEVFWNT